MNAAEKLRIEKLVGMLGSDFDAERAAFAKKLSDIAKSNRQSVVELLRDCFASAPLRAPEPIAPTRPAYAQPKAHKPQPYRAEKSEPWAWDDATDDLRERLRRVVDFCGFEYMTDWEIKFTQDILRKSTVLSERQEDALARLIKKLIRSARAHA